MHLSSNSQPVCRVWIPKPGRDEKRPLGIPTMNDRALQALFKQALEPEWEARFEPNSYGFVRLVSAAERVPTLERATPPHRLCA